MCVYIQEINLKKLTFVTADLENMCTLGTIGRINEHRHKKPVTQRRIQRAGAGGPGPKLLYVSLEILVRASSRSNSRGSPYMCPSVKYVDG